MKANHFIELESLLFFHFAAVHDPKPQHALGKSKTTPRESPVLKLEDTYSAYLGLYFFCVRYILGTFHGAFEDMLSLGIYV